MAEPELVTLTPGSVRVYQMPLDFEVKCEAKDCQKKNCPVGTYRLTPEAVLSLFVNNYNLGCRKALIYPSRFVNIYEFGGILSFEEVKPKEKITCNLVSFMDSNYHEFKLACNIKKVSIPIGVTIKKNLDLIVTHLSKMREPNYPKAAIYKVLYLSLGKNNYPSLSHSPVQLVGATGSGKTLLLDRFLYFNKEPPYNCKIQGNGSTSMAGVLGYRAGNKFIKSAFADKEVIHVEEFSLLPREIRVAMMNSFYDEPVIYAKAGNQLNYWSTYIVLSCNKITNDVMVNRRLLNIPLNGKCSVNLDEIYEAEALISKFRDKYSALRRFEVKIPKPVEEGIKRWSRTYGDMSGLNNEKGPADWFRIGMNFVRGSARANARRQATMQDLEFLERVFE